MTGSKGTILIVEDALVVAHSIQATLESSGYQVADLAKNAEEAFASLERAVPDLILMDVHLSGSADGIEVANRVRERHQIPVIFLTAYSDEATLERAKITEPFGYIIKPFNTRELVNNVEIALYRKRMERELAQSEARFRGLFRQASVGVILVTASGAVVGVNDRMVELLGPAADTAARVAEFVADLEPGSNPALAAGVPVERKLHHAGLEPLVVRVQMARITDGSGGFTALFVDDITAIRRSEAELTASQAALRTLFQTEEAIRDRQRTDLSRDIHDGLGQMLTAVKMGIYTLRAQFRDLHQVESADAMIAEVDQMIDYVKRVCSELRDNVLDDFGLRDALEVSVRKFQERTGISVDLAVDCDTPAYPQDVQVTLMRIIQEALTNVARHADASEVAIRCVVSDDGQVWSITDDGTGFTVPAASAATLGLLGMRERAASCGAVCTVRSTPGAGATVEVRLPHERCA